MSGTQRGRSGVSKDYSEDGSSQSRSSNNQSRNRFNLRSQPIQESSNFGFTHRSCNSSRKQHINTLKRNLIDDQSSSDSEDDEKLFHPVSHGILRPLSDYETGESSDRTSRPTRNCRIKVNDQEPKPSFSTSLPQQYLDSDFSSDDSVVSPRRARRLKRPLSPTSTSGSSDSGLPISSRRCFKRMKLFSSSESSSSSDDNRGPEERNDIGRDNLVGSHPARNSRYDQENEERDPRVRVLKRRTPETGSESESDLVSTIHIVRGRRIPVIESEDDVGSPTEYTSTNSTISSVEGANHRVSSVLGVRETRRRRTRRRRITLPQQEYERGSTINSSRPVSINPNVSRQVVGNGVRGPLSGGRSVWHVSSQVEESEDDAAPVSHTRCVRGRRIPVVETEDDSDSVSNSLNNNGGNEVSIRLETNVINIGRRSPIASSDEGNISRDYNLRRTAVPLVQSENESSNSESEIRPRALSSRIIPIFQSDDSSSTSSSSTEDSDDSIPIRNPRRRNNRPIPIVDYDYEDMTNDFVGFDVNIKASTIVKSFDSHQVLKGNSSDSDGEIEKCPICLTGFKLQEIGKPTSCDHQFCSLCIKEWATKSNTCPVDRKVFNGIVIYDKIEGKIICEQPVEKPNTSQYEEDSVGNFAEILMQFQESSSSEESWFFDSDGDGPDEICAVCGSSNRPHRMITCDSCGSVYHLECLDPPLRYFPTMNWYCTPCQFDMFSDSN